MQHGRQSRPRQHHHHEHNARAFVREVAAACEKRGLRLTEIRGQVLELIAASEKPVKAYDLLDQLKDDRSNAAPPTVYRALDFLLENGFIHKLESINAYVSCHHPSVAHHVPFLICDVCESPRRSATSASPSCSASRPSRSAFVRARRRWKCTGSASAARRRNLRSPR